ncbi:hypothetical protein Vadar_014718 [Vaccinium darrowii]|uniref:Uncharacterized protein n=1 Tax=Vaccinium darrowii TaxID=229202 RepID=A0ACB7XR44_9ERIC|nr:hypothetical protein Vadar_014718 [Vaccinium darrowii]
MTESSIAGKYDKKSKVCEYAESDRISSLPDDVLFKLNVQELDLIFDMDFVHKLPQSLLTSAHLKMLKLSGEVNFQFPMLVFLPSLKVLRLYWLRPLDEDSLKNPITGCPILEELDIRSSTLPNCRSILGVNGIVNSLSS